MKKILGYLFYFLFSILSADSKKIYIFPGEWGELFAIDNPIYNRDNCLEPMCILRDSLKKIGYDLIQIKDLKNLNKDSFVISFDISLDHLQYFKNNSKEKNVVFLWEPPSIKLYNFENENHEYFTRVYTWKDNLVNNEKYYKFYYPRLLAMTNDLIDFDNKKFCVIITGNGTSNHPNELYSERLKVIKFFENLNNKELDFYGRWWQSNSFKNFKGKIDKKLDVLKQYKYCVCYENIKNESGYISEKIFDCFQAGCVPIYWGAPNITEYIPKDCFIDRRNFKNESELYKFLKDVTKNEYIKYIENINKFLKSEKAYLYSVENFINIFINMIISIDYNTEKFIRNKSLYKETKLEIAENIHGLILYEPSKIHEYIKLYGKEIFEYRDKDNNTALMFAINYENNNIYPVVTQMLINLGADVNALGISNTTPLMFAVRQGNIQKVRLLLENGANLNIKDVFSKTALDMAKEYGFKNIENLIIGFYEN